MNPPPEETSRWKRLFSKGLDLLYPPLCGVCGTLLSNGQSLCQRCNGDLPRLADPFCKRCGEPFPGDIEGDFTCPNCSTLKLSFDFARAAMIRDDRTLELIHRLKYGKELHLAKSLGLLATEALQDSRFEKARAESWPLVPVPLHRRRLQQRHFNQAEEIAREISRQTGMPMLKALRRVRATGHQTSLTRKQRLENLRGAFEMTRQGLRHPADRKQGVILVDDVFTTGATASECAKVLRKAGFRAVTVVTVMRG